MIRLTHLQQITDFCPSQWEGKDDQNRPIYIRYRGGLLRYILGQPDEQVDDIIPRPYDVEMQVGDKYDGRMYTEEMLRHLAQSLELTPNAEVEGFAAKDI